MSSLITVENHIVRMIHLSGLYRMLRLCGHGPSYQPDARIMPYLDAMRFGSVALIHVFELRGDLIRALVEQWHPEMHTFHLLCREYTITLEDVAIQLGLLVDGEAITSSSGIANLATLCYSLAGHSPSDGIDKFKGLKFSWLKGVFVLDSNNNKAHLMYLPLLSNLQGACSYSWGSTVLAMLHRELCRVTKHRIVDIVHVDTVYRVKCYFRHSLSARAHAIVWCVNAPIINFQMVEWYAKDRVLCQFRCRQHILDIPTQLGNDAHEIDKKGKHAKNWALEHQPYIVLWNVWLERRLYLE
ncbi:hypothetical protein PVK06_027286 [Gossypium arboreum]|uniref:Aminotransferase-like plant mobile domain-containing protein n=1 Tax=Gossypium arboreum TaxID=29729 RepID=A0ABR0P3D4_GOSAR|nr:hypothetical protein PVK06_027286 [Gossypium arboreum]